MRHQRVGEGEPERDLADQLQPRGVARRRPCPQDGHGPVPDEGEHLVGRRRCGFAVPPDGRSARPGQMVPPDAGEQRLDQDVSVGRPDRPAGELRRASALGPVGAERPFDPGEIPAGGTPDQCVCQSALAAELVVEGLPGDPGTGRHVDHAYGRPGQRGERRVRGVQQCFSRRWHRRLPRRGPAHQSWGARGPCQGSAQGPRVGACGGPRRAGPCSPAGWLWIL